MKLPETVRKYIPDPHDVLLIVGTAAIVRGVLQIHRPTAWIVAGLAAVVYSVLAAAATTRRKPE
jgi:hypothetical protein